jgi:hypothetical protein
MKKQEGAACPLERASVCTCTAFRLKHQALDGNLAWEKASLDCIVYILIHIGNLEVPSTTMPFHITEEALCLDLNTIPASSRLRT